MLYSLPWFRKSATIPVVTFVTLKPKPDITFGQNPENQWGGCTRNHYIYQYREELAELAKKLRGGVGPKIYVRFNEKKGCAELLTNRNGIIASVKIEGEAGLAYAAKICLKSPDTPKELFVQTFSGLTVGFCKLSPD